MTPPPVYLINLPRDAERLRAMAAQLDAQGWAFERVPAVYGRDLSPTQRDALYDATANRRQWHHALVDGEIGCYASHLLVWQQLLDSGAPAALVLEDDVQLLPTLAPVLQAIAGLPVGWDMVKLVGRDAESPLTRWPLCSGVDLIRYRRVPSLTGAYVVSREGARKLLARRQPFFRPIDVDLRYWWECNLRLFGASPYPTRLSEAAQQSSIGGRQGDKTSAMRWRKLRNQMHYSLLNWWFSRRRQDAFAPGA